MLLQTRPSGAVEQGYTMLYGESRMKKKLLSAIIIMLTFLAGQTLKAGNITIAEGWKFKTGDNIEWANPAFNDSDWKPIKAGISWEEQGYDGLDGYAWYRVKFFLPSSITQDAINRDSILFNLGKIDDYDQTYLNGKLIGENGQMMTAEMKNTADFTKTDTKYNVDRSYVLAVDNKAILWDKENILAIRVYDNHGPGGIISLTCRRWMKARL